MTHTSAVAMLDFAVLRNNVLPLLELWIFTSFVQGSNTVAAISNRV
jgi:hypothetical protein